MMPGAWRDVVRVHRLEHPFPIHYLCHATVGAAYAVADVGQLFAGPVLVALVATLLLVVSGNPINAAVDVVGDAETAGKSDIADAVRRLGRTIPLTLAAVEMALALTLAIVVSLWTGRPLVSACVALAVVLCLLYNLEPVRLKRRGFANPITLGLFYGLLPALATYLAVRSDIHTSTWLVFAALTLLLVGRTLWWSASDRAGDRKAGVATPAVRYGVTRTLLIAYGLTVVSLGLLGCGLLTRFGPWWALIGVAASAAFAAGTVTRLARRRLLLPVTVTDIVVVLIPLVA